jgi:hypothetical protein
MKGVGGINEWNREYMNGVEIHRIWIQLSKQ